jgi:hypothetical protein
MPRKDEDEEEERPRTSSGNLKLLPEEWGLQKNIAPAISKGAFPVSPGTVNESEFDSKVKTFMTKPADF